MGTTSSTSCSVTGPECGVTWLAGGRTRWTASSSSSPRRWISLLSRPLSARPSSRLLSTRGSPELVTGSSWTPVRSVLGERLVRTPALEMEDLLWSVRLSLGDGQWWVWLPGALDVPRTCLESMLIFISSGIGLIPFNYSLLYFIYLLYLRMRIDNISPRSFLLMLRR